MDGVETGQRARTAPWIVAAWLLAAIAGACASVLLYPLAVPEASIEFSLTRDEALETGEDFLEARGFDVSGFRTAADFSWSYTGRNYLEKELSLREANAVMAEEPGIWYWRCRWFKPEQREEFFVWLGPDGRLVGFSHVIPEDRAAGAVDEERALALAKDFLGEHGVDLSRYELSDSSSQTLPARVDRYFTWENRNRAKNADAYAYVYFQGDKIGYFSRGLDVPEQWEREQQGKNAWRAFLTQIAQLFHYGLQIAALLVCIGALRNRHAPFLYSIALALFVALVAGAAAINRLALAWIHYRTTQAPGAFIGQMGMDFLGDFLSTLLMTFVLALAAHRVQELVFREHPPLGAMFTSAFWRSRAVFTAILVGYCLFFMHAGFFNIFYVAGKSYLGVWAGQEAPYRNILASPFPFLAPLTTGLTASVYEELLFRLVAIGLLLRYTGSRVVAVVLPAIVWAFLHSNYPQEPIYIRGLELTAVGIVYGAVFLRYGVIATLISHFAYNAVLSSMVLFTSHDAYLRSCGLLVACVVALPAVPGAVQWLRYRTWMTVTPLPDFEIHLPAKAEAETGAFRPVKLQSVRAYALLACAGLIGFALIGVNTWSGTWIGMQMSGLARAIGLPQTDAQKESPYRPIVMSTTRQAAGQMARSWLTERGVSMEGWRSVVTSRSQWRETEMIYLHEQVNRERWRDWADRYLPDRTQWRVRFFQPLVYEEYIVYVNPDGSVFTYLHEMNEEAPGEELTTAEARERAEDRLGSMYNLDPNGLRLLSETSEELDHRTDHHFVWERAGFFVPPLSFRMRLHVHGDEVFGLTPYLHVPESWSRERNRQTTADVIADIAAVIVMIIVGAPLGYTCLVMALHREISWRVWFGPALLFTLPAVFDQLSALPRFWSGYNTDVEPGLYAGQYVVAVVRSLAITLLSYWVGCSLIHALFKKAFPDYLPWRTWLSPAHLRAHGEDVRRVYSDGVLTGGLLAAALMLGPSLLGLTRHFANVDVRQGWALLNPVTVFPSHGAITVLASTANLIELSITFAFVVALIAAYIRLFFRRPMWIVIALVAVAGLSRIESLQLQSSPVFALWWTAGIVTALLALRYVPRVLSGNAVVTLWTGVSLALISQSADLFLKPDSVSNALGWLCVSLYGCAMILAAAGRFQNKATNRST